MTAAERARSAMNPPSLSACHCEDSTARVRHLGYGVWQCTGCADKVQLVDPPVRSFGRPAGTTMAMPQRGSSWKMWTLGVALVLLVAGYYQVDSHTTPGRVTARLTVAKVLVVQHPDGTRAIIRASGGTWAGCTVGAAWTGTGCH